MTEREPSALHDEDFAVYLSSGSDEGSDDDDGDGLRVEGEDVADGGDSRAKRAKQRVRNRYAILLDGLGATAAATTGDDEMIITFQSGLQEAGEQLLDTVRAAEAAKEMTLQEKRQLKKVKVTYDPNTNLC
jgi:hypothetical protein